jgi:hypothetical protein
MKTNQLMEVRLGKFGVVPIWHKTQMGKLNDVLEIGNAIRESKGLKPKKLDTYLRSKTTWELILKVYNEMLNDGFITLDDEKSISAIAEKVEEDKKSSWVNTQKVLYQETLDDLPQDSQGRIKYAAIAKTKVFESVFKVQNRGKLINRGIWANLFIMLDLAQWLDVDLRYEIYKTFIEGKILIHRDNGGEEFKKLNTLIDTLPDRIKRANEKGKPVSKSNKSAYIKIAQLVNEKVKGSFSKGWNEKEDIVEFQAKREKLLNFLSNTIEFGFISSYNQLKATIEKYKFN